MTPAQGAKTLVPITKLNSSLLVKLYEFFYSTSFEDIIVIFVPRKRSGVKLLLQCVKVGFGSVCET